MLAAGIAGGAKAVGDQAGDQIAMQNRMELMRQESAIRTDAEQRLIEYRAQTDRTSAQNKATDALGFESADTTLAARGKIATAAGDSARAVKLADATDQGLNDAQRKKLADDAKATHDAAADQAIADSNNPALMQAKKALALADPKTAAEIEKIVAEKGYFNAHAQAVLMTARAAQDRADGGLNKMPEAQKLEYQNLAAEAKAALANQAKFEAESTGGLFDKDKNPTDQYRVVQANTEKAARALDAFRMRSGMMNPDDMADRAIAGETSSAKIGEAVKQAYAMGGKDFGDKFYARVQASGALERNAEQAAQAADTDAKKRGMIDMPEPASSGLFTGPRLIYLQNKDNTGRINAAEKKELGELLATKGKEWFRGLATAEDSIAN
jgi:hypothetical protein